MIPITAPSLFGVLTLSINIPGGLTEVAAAMLSDWIVFFNSIICTEAEFSKVCALQHRQLLIALLTDTFHNFNYIIVTEVKILQVVPLCHCQMFAAFTAYFVEISIK